jgi:hydroxymethylpyrimidine/phosphomethylpyrimidine kinase
MKVSGERYPYAVHGSGCCFSAALTACLARGMALRESFCAAREFIDTAIREAVGDAGGVRVVNPGGRFIHRR